MKGQVALGAIGQVARSVADVVEAEAWYRDVLGLSHLFTFGELAFFSDLEGRPLALISRVAGEV